MRAAAILGLRLLAFALSLAALVSYVAHVEWLRGFTEPKMALNTAAAIFALSAAALLRNGGPK